MIDYNYLEDEWKEDLDKVVKSFENILDWVNWIEERVERNKFDEEEKVEKEEFLDIQIDLMQIGQ